MGSDYRSLKTDEISLMIERGCVCEDWSRILVKEGFRPSRLKNVVFYGDNRIGLMDGRMDFNTGISRKCGIYNTTLHNCDVRDNVYIRNVSNYISNYVIEEGVVIDSVNTMQVTSRTSFGNGTRVAVINEDGGREIPIYDKLSAHEAYVMALYRHRINLVSNLRNLIDEYAEAVSSGTGIIGRGAHISNCNKIENVKIGPYAEIEGVVRLTNGTVNSRKAAPSVVGSGVIADDFIMATGSSIRDGVIIDKCFIGQGTELAKQYSAENSVFFANCGGFHGEACSIFAGPYTVTHHKSTLLIAGLYSFMNAGSGSNQSNHMYKLGPVHQGILERGSKTTSNSYILFPTKVGAYTLVMGRHYSKSDTSDFPFSYLIEEDDESVLVPGVNIKSVGTVRDSKKWPNRDKRTDPDKLDHITFYLLTPYTVQKMIGGRQLLEQLRDTSGHSTQKYYLNGVRLGRPALEKGMRYYEMGITRFVGNVLVTLMQNNRYSNLDELRALFGTGDSLGCSKWLDLAGLIVPEAAAERLFTRIETGEVSGLDEIKTSLAEMHEKYSAYEIAWMTERLETVLNKPYTEFTARDIEIVLDKWINAVETMDRLRCEDARKEFSMTSMVGFGIDGDNEEKKRDFTEVRGEEESNDFIIQLKNRLRLKQQTVAELKERLRVF